MTLPFVEPPSASPEGELPKIARRYQLQRRIGSGGMGRVYEAWDTHVGRPVALKIVRARHARCARTVERFQLEMKATARVDHPNIVRLYDYGYTSANRIFLVIELIEGKLLGDLVATGPIDAWRAALLTAQIARGLAALHNAGIVHRDLKPSNIMITMTDERTEQVKLIDLGIAQVEGPGKSDRLTLPGKVMGTPAFMSPESVAQRPVDHRSDLYQLGGVLHYMLTGFPPWSGHASRVMHAHLHTPAPSARQRNPNVPRWADNIMKRLLEKDPERRYYQAEDVVAALEEASGVNSTFATLNPTEPTLRVERPTAELPGLVFAVGAAVGAAVAMLLT